MTKTKNNIFLLSLTTLFLFLSCLLINSYSNKYSVKANSDNGIILQSEIDCNYMCEVNDSGSDFIGDIIFNYSVIFYEETFEFDLVFFKVASRLNYMLIEENLWELNFRIDNIRDGNGDIIGVENIVSINLWNYFFFDYSQYPIDSAFQYTNPYLVVEVEIETLDDYYYFATEHIEIPFNNEFDNPYVLNLNENIVYSFGNETYSFGFEDGYYRGYHDGLSENGRDAYEQGYEDGYNDSSLDPMTFISSIFSGINDIFSVEIFPGFKIWYLIGAPLIVALIIGVLKFLR